MAYEYSSADVAVAWSGIPFSGFAADSMIVITPTEDNLQANSGSDGLQEISFSPDKSGTVIISLQQGSITARLLAATVQLAPQTSGDLTIIDPSGSIFALCRGARIMTRAEITRGVNAGDNTNDWGFWCEELIYTGTPSGINPDLAVVGSIVGSLV